MKQVVKTVFILSLLVLAVLPACSSQPEVEGKGVYDWIALLRHDDLGMQEKARNALVTLGESALPYLQRNLLNKDPAIRRGVVMVVGRLGAKAKPLVADLLKLLRREEVDVIRAEIIRALIAVAPRDSQVVKTFRKRLRDRSPEVRRLAQQGLDESAPPREKQKTKPGATPPVSELQLRATLQANLTNEPFALLGEVEREPLRAALVWLPRDTGKNGDRIRAFIFRKRGQQWLEEGKPLDLAGRQGTTRLTQALGGADKQRLVRPCGVATDQLAAYLVQWGSKFDQARRNNDAAGMATSLEMLSRAFSYRLVAFEGVVFQLLQAALLTRPEAVKLGEDKKSISLGTAGALLLANCGRGRVVSAWQQTRQSESTGDSGDKHKTGSQKPAKE